MLRCGARRSAAVAVHRDLRRRHRVPVAVDSRPAANSSKQPQSPSTVPLSGEEALDLIGVLQFALQMTMWQRQRTRMEELICRAIVLFEGCGDVLPSELHASSPHSDDAEEIHDVQSESLSASSFPPEGNADLVLQDPMEPSRLEATTRQQLTTSTAATTPFPFHLLPLGVLIPLPVQAPTESMPPPQVHETASSTRTQVTAGVPCELAEMALKHLAQQRRYDWLPLQTHSTAEAACPSPQLLLAAPANRVATTAQELPSTHNEPRNAPAVEATVPAKASRREELLDGAHTVPKTETTRVVAPTLAVRLLRRYLLECCVAGLALPKLASVHHLVCSLSAGRHPPPRLLSTIMRFERILCAEFGWADTVSSTKAALRRQRAPGAVAPSFEGRVLTGDSQGRAASQRGPRELETALVHQCSSALARSSGNEDDTVVHENVAGLWLELETAYPHLAVGPRVLGALERCIRARCRLAASTSPSPRWVQVARQLRKHGLDSDWLENATVGDSVRPQVYVEFPTTPVISVEPRSSKLYERIKSAEQQAKVRRSNSAAKQHRHRNRYHATSWK